MTLIQEQIEVVIDKSGQPRQAGATQPGGEYIEGIKKRAERSHYYFTKAILKRHYLNPVLHGGVTRFLSQSPPYRKMLLLPREHCKTSLVSHSLPCHAIIQPKENNVYVPGRAGVDTRILLAGETIDRASKNLSVIQSVFESNQLFRALWPHVTYTDPKKEAKKWNANEMLVPRNIDYPDPTVQAIGVGGAITGARFDVVIKDDLISLEAANSELVMQETIRWHRASRALHESDQTLEYIIGTRWSVFDLYSFIAEGGILDGEHFDKDYTVDAVVRHLVEDSNVIYPEKFSIEPSTGKQDVEMLKRQFGILFYLNYMNSAANPELTDFNAEHVRYFSIVDDHFLFEIDDSVATDPSSLLASPEPKLKDELRGKPLSLHYDIVKERHEFLRLRR